jgi:hypothetical protein
MSQARAARKIIKKLRSPDDNDKLSALVYLTKVFPSPAAMADSEFSKNIWASLRSTQFLERAIHSDEFRPLILLVLSVFCRLCPAPDLISFVPLLASFADDAYSNEASETLAEIAQSLDDLSVVFEAIPIRESSIPFLARAASGARGLRLTPAVFNARAMIFGLLTGRESLSLRRHLLSLIAGLVRLNGSFSVFRSQSSVDVSGFLAAERLALIELRLQLDIPPDHKGDLLQPGLSSAACDLLDLLMHPLLSHEDELTDSQVDTYFENVNSMIHDAFEIFRAVKGQRDRDRIELKCLLVTVAKWLREAPFLCQNRDVVTGVKQLVQILWWFPIEAVHFVPAFEELHQKESQQFRAAGFHELANRMAEHAEADETEAINRIAATVYKT